MPPNYRANQATHGTRCAECKNFREVDPDSFDCTKFGIQTKIYMTCDAWNRNPKIPPTVF